MSYDEYMKLVDIEREKIIKEIAKLSTRFDKLDKILLNPSPNSEKVIGDLIATTVRLFNYKIYSKEEWLTLNNGR